MDREPQDPMFPLGAQLLLLNCGERPRQQEMAHIFGNVQN